MTPTDKTRNQHPSRTRTATFLSGLCLTAAAALGCGAPGLEGFEESTQPIENGTETNARPEVARFDSPSLPSGSRLMCTATLIHPRYLTTAAHCIEYVPSIAGGTVTIHTVNPSTGARVSNVFNVDRTYSFSNVGVGVWDGAIIRLQAPVPANIATPAVIADGAPAGGETMTHMGYGCNVWSTAAGTSSGTGIKRFSQGAWGEIRDNCPGDSGGPVFFGALGDNGPMAYVNSNGQDNAKDAFALDGFADAIYFRERIEQTIRNLESGLEVGMNRFGADYANATASSASSCRSRCTRDARCKAFSFVHSTTMCFLKKAAAKATPDANVTSGLPGLTTNDVLTGPSSSIITSLVVANRDFCAFECMKNSSCLAYHHNATIGGANCTLYKVVPSGSFATSTSSTSGFRRGGEVDTDRPAGDHRASTAGISLSTCMARCGTDARCKAVVHDGSTCWFKGEVRPSRNATGLKSAVRRGLEYNVDRPGADFRSFTMSEPRPERCQTECSINSSCKSWTMDLAGNCFLKSGIPLGVSSRGFVSGIKGAAFF